MKSLIVTVAALALSAGVAFAQATTQNAPAQQSQGQGQTQQQGGGDNFPSVQPPPPPSLDQQPGGQVDRSDGWRGDQMTRHHRGRHGGRTAHFSIETGGAKIKVRCGADQSSNQCVDMVSQLLEQVQSSDSGNARDGRERDRDRYSHRDSRWDHLDRDWHDDRDRRGRD
ncbi:hypothetical protein [Rhizobium halophilum]|uniref:hypothetical protein n=1 Tax=Rhizobium halophilum TaxID=2846852 RepID=UPI001EFC4432|nr:hypothetical protein [Rhizobium halophilum]MCF6371210.1 hypothetical protein [Rhizobium halophilum]